MFQYPLPKRVRALVLGGGIHGVGVLHDLVSRGWKDVHLVEKGRLASGTSSRSTKLIHGGLRYLQKISQFSMVSESLRERNFLLHNLPDIVNPIEFILPVAPDRPWDSWMFRAGLTIYDGLSGKKGVGRHRTLLPAEVKDKASILAFEKFSHFFSFWDAQVDDLALVWRVAESAVSLGAGISEGAQVETLRKTSDGWFAEVRTPDGRLQPISALYIVNCLGPWANTFLENSNLEPVVRGINDKGAHILVRDLGLKAGLFLRSPIDGRVFFMLPWKGFSLLGTTEEVYTENPDEVAANEKDIEYILRSCNAYLHKPLCLQDVLGSFAGLRWLAETSSNSLSAVPRESTFGEHSSERGLMITVYGGKLTSYRSLAQKVGDRLNHHFGDFQSSKTADKASWVRKNEARNLEPIPDVFERFQPSYLHHFPT